MKVHYETILQALDRVISDADKGGRRIQKIELTPREWFDFQVEVASMARYTHPSLPILTEYSGVQIVKVAP
jgi:hypothetical protein